MPRLAIVLAAIAVLLGGLAPAQGRHRRDRGQIGAAPVGHGRRRAALSNGRCRPRAWATARRTAATSRSGWRANGSRANTTGRRCPIRSSSTAATPSTAATRSRISAGRPRTAASACIPTMPRILFALVKEHVDDTSIVVTGERPEPAARSTRARLGAATRRRRVAAMPTCAPAPREYAVAIFLIPPPLAGRGQPRSIRERRAWRAV